MKRNEMATAILAGILANQFTVVPEDSDPSRTAKMAIIVNDAVTLADMLAVKLAE